MRALVPAVSAQLAAIGRDDGGAELEPRSRHDLAMGSEVRAGAGAPLPPGTAEHGSVVASRRDVLPSGRQVDVLISRGRLNGCDDRLSPERKRDAVAAKHFLQKALRSPGHPRPRVINVDRNPSYPKACRNYSSPANSVGVVDVDRSLLKKWSNRITEP